jgi:2-polyprenyl-3-methyl-5-hydroxy-6-metoxy-1,4-benzoquinol methylase
MNRYGWKGQSQPLSCNYIVPAVIRLLGAPSERKVLDLGSGNGVLCRELDRLGFSVAGVEPSPDGWLAATEASPSIPFYNLSVDDCPDEIVASEGLFDVVVSTEVVEHLYAPHLLSRFAWQCLKPGGSLIVSTPYHGYLKNLAIAVLGNWDNHHTSLWCGGHIKFWSRQTLVKLLEDEGFSFGSFHGIGRLPWFWKSMILVVSKPAA